MSRNCATSPETLAPAPSSNAFVNKLGNCAASFTPTLARGSARRSRVTSSALIHWILLDCCSPILSNCTATGGMPTIKRLSRDWENFMGGQWRRFGDTRGAYLGMDAEERGEGEEIARNVREMARLQVPVIVTVTGEGGSGGALAIAVGDRVNILENSFYSVISPEGCASIIWRDSTKAETAAAAMKITAKDLKELGIVDEIVAEPEGGAHTDFEGAARFLDEVLDRQLVALTNQPVRELLDARYEKFRKMGQFFDLGN